VNEAGGKEEHRRRLTMRSRLWECLGPLGFAALLLTLGPGCEKRKFGPDPNKSTDENFDHVKTEEQAASILKKYARLTRSDELPDAPVTKIALGPVTPSEARLLRFFESLEWLDCSEPFGFIGFTDKTLLALPTFKKLKRFEAPGARLTSESLPVIGKLTTLTNLDLSKTQITDENFASLSELKALEVLRLCETPITDESLSHLSGLTRLRILNLDQTGISNAGMVHLKTLQNLKTLTLEDTPITDNGLSHLSQMRSLRYLDLNGTQVTGEGLRHVAQHPIETLYLHIAPISDAGMASLAGMAQLQTLGLSKTMISDAGLKHLFGLQALRWVALDGTKVTGEGMLQLQRALPGLQIVGDNLPLENQSD
jgi:hypothetical protein